MGRSCAAMIFCEGSESVLLAKPTGEEGPDEGAGQCRRERFVGCEGGVRGVGVWVWSEAVGELKLFGAVSVRGYGTMDIPVTCAKRRRVEGLA